MIIRQGDILILSVDQLPDAPIVPAKRGNLILAEGEVTGHAHFIPSLEAVMLEANDAMRHAAAVAGVADTSTVLGGLRIATATTLYHGTPVQAPAVPHDGDHTFLPLPAGDYVFLAPREYTGESEWRRVAD
jgi:hypothetical protein